MNQSAKKSVSIAAAWIFGTVIFAIVLVAGGLSLYINVVVGLTMGIAGAVMFAIGDVTKMVLPVAMQAVGKTVLLRSIYWMVTLVSFVCAFLATADMFGTQFVTTHTAQKIETVGAENLKDLRASLDVARAMMLAESKNKGCKDKCTALVARVDILEKEIKVQVVKQQANTTAAMSGKAILGQTMFEVAGTKIDTYTTAMIVVFQMVMMEMISLMSGFAAGMIGHAMKLSADKKAEIIAKKVAAEKKIAAAAKKVETAKKKAAAARKLAAAAKKKAATEGQDAEAAKKLAAAEKIIEAKKIALEKKNLAAAKRRAVAAAKKAAAEAKKIAAAAKKAAARKVAAEKKATRKTSPKVVQLVRSQEKISA